MAVRELVLDTETTGLEVEHDHRIIEIGVIELVDRQRTGNDCHLYLNPEREVDTAAYEVHGLDWPSLAQSPRFADVAEQLRTYLGDAQLVIHNAPFDLGFLDAEFARIDSGHTPIADRSPILDTLKKARQMFPGQRANLDRLCRQYGIDNSDRTEHGAFLDASLLTEVYLAMTGGQTRLDMAPSQGARSRYAEMTVTEVIESFGKRPRVVRAHDDEAAADREFQQTRIQQTA